MLLRISPAKLVLLALACGLANAATMPAATMVAPAGAWQSFFLLHVAAAQLPQSVFARHGSHDDGV